MPYASIADLPAAVKNNLPADAQAIFRAAFNNAEKGNDETTAFKIAWSAVKRAGYTQTSGGKWVKKNLAVKEPEPFDVSKMEEWEQTVEIAKVDASKRLVFGFAYVNKRNGEQVTDHSGDQVDLENLEDTAYDFVLNFAETGEMHRGVAKGHIVESMVFTPEKIASIEKITGEKIPENLVGSWWTGTYIAEPGIGEPDVYAKVLDGTYKMFSIQGLGTREAM